VEDNLNWLEAHRDSEAEEYESKLKEFENVFHPIMTKMYQSGQGPAGAQPG